MEMSSLGSPAYAQTVPTREVSGRSFAPRFWAYVIDVIVLNIVNGLIALFAGFVAVVVLTLAAGDVADPSKSTTGLDLLQGVLLNLVYFALFEWLYGATPGKILLRMRVVQLDGEPCGLVAALARGAWRYVDGLFFGVVAYVSMKPYLYQRVGDKRARTVVTASNDPAVQNRRSGWGFLAAIALYGAIATVCLFVYAWLMFNPA